MSFAHRLFNAHPDSRAHCYLCAMRAGCAQVRMHEHLVCVSHFRVDGVLFYHNFYAIDPKPPHAVHLAQLLLLCMVHSAMRTVP